MTKKPSTKKGSTKGKAEGSKGPQRQSVKQRARAIVADAEAYDEETRNAIKNALDEDGDLAELVRRAEAGEQILDVSKPLGGAPPQAEADAHDYAQKAYNAALAHFYANQGDPFALSRLAVVYDEQKPGDVHMVFTLPGELRDGGVSDEEVHGWIRDGELFARTLDHDRCPEAFATALGAVFTETMIDGLNLSLTTPEVLRVAFPLAMLYATGSSRESRNGAARDILILLCSELVSDEVQNEVRKPLGLQ
jgi:hypothetical protein